MSCFLTVTSLWVKSDKCWILCISSPITYKYQRIMSNDLKPTLVRISSVNYFIVMIAKMTRLIKQQHTERAGDLDSVLVSVLYRTQVM